MKTITYTRLDGMPITIDYDETAPCHWCGLPVITASVCGTACCPWCDLGVCRFVPGHRVDMEGIDPTTGKMFPPQKHYERWRCVEWKITLPEGIR